MRTFSRDSRATKAKTFTGTASSFGAERSGSSAVATRIDGFLGNVFEGVMADMSKVTRLRLGMPCADISSLSDADPSVVVRGSTASCDKSVASASTSAFSETRRCRCWLKEVYLSRRYVAVRASAISEASTTFSATSKDDL
jgi:hypothetical protein